MELVKTHELNLNTTAFNQFANSDYIIVESNTIKVNDYVLFKQVETVDDKVQETGLYRMTQVREIIHHIGLKDGYILIIVTKL